MEVSQVPQGFKIDFALRLAVLDAQRRAPYESCGLITQSGDFFNFEPCKNISDTPLLTFEISPDDFIKFGDVVGIVHSHPNGRLVLSGADRTAQITSGLPWHLIVDDRVKTFRPCPHLIGREFHHGTQDCYSLFRDAYMLSGLDLPNFYRHDNWWEEEIEMYLGNIASVGFYQIERENFRTGDVILMQLKSDRANHAAVYLGDEHILHHTPNRLSKRDLYSGYWQKHTHSIWRHEKWQSLDFTGIFNDLESSSTSM